jgi:Protein of unknown function (DUF4197)
VDEFVLAMNRAAEKAAPAVKDIFWNAVKSMTFDDQLKSAYQPVPLASALPPFDIESYVVSKALDGLFYVLGQEENQIRTNPSAQVTAS